MSLRTMLKSKIHRATVTGADVNYEGSITLDPLLMEAAEIIPYEQVHVLDMLRTGHHQRCRRPPDRRRRSDHHSDLHRSARGRRAFSSPDPGLRRRRKPHQPPGDGFDCAGFISRNHLVNQ